MSTASAFIHMERGETVLVRTIDHGSHDRPRPVPVIYLGAVLIVDIPDVAELRRIREALNTWLDTEGARIEAQAAAASVPPAEPEPDRPAGTWSGDPQDLARP